MFTDALSPVLFTRGVWPLHPMQSEIRRPMSPQAAQKTDITKTFSTTAFYNHRTDKHDMEPGHTPYPVSKLMSAASYNGSWRRQQVYIGQWQHRRLEGSVYVSELSRNAILCSERLPWIRHRGVYTLLDRCHSRLQPRPLPHYLPRLRRT
jgi:hypothetical protein